MPQDVENLDPSPLTQSLLLEPRDGQNTTRAGGYAPGPVAGLPAQIGSCRIEGEIGSGGMGVVLRGHDVDFGRTLAVKVLRAKRQDASLVQRFLQEAQITAQLQHPGIPPVHAVGKLDDGRPFFTMKLIKGQTLDVLLKQSTNRAADLPRFLAIFTQVCQTLAYAHSHGVVHRDLKPANIMVGAFGEVQVMDWGLAKLLGGGPEAPITAPEQAGADAPRDDATTVFSPAASDTSLHTQAGNVMGTLAFMAPEQARGQVHQLDERCDVFGLGAILCVILTGKPPNVGSTKTQLHRQAAKGIMSEAMDRLDACGADAELVQLTKACLSRAREDRPRQAGVVAEAMAAYHAKMQERLRAAEMERAAAEIKAREERKRRKLAVGLAAAVLGFVLLGIGGWWWVSWEQTQREADTARVVNEAIQETTRLRGRAEAAPVGELAPWKEALGIVKRAEDLLASGAATPELTQAVATLRADLEAGLAKAQQAADAAELDRNMLVWLHEVRLTGADVAALNFNTAEVEKAFAAAFRKYGLDVDNHASADAAQRIRGRPIQSELVAALDSWAWKRRCIGKDRAGWERLFAVARAVEPEPWRERLRNALAQSDGNELARLSVSADVAALPISVQVLLAEALFYKTRLEGSAFLCRAIQEHPRDFWINYYLGLNYHYFAAPPNYPEAIRFFTAALVADDRSPTLYAYLGYALSTQEKALDESIAVYEKAIRLDPAYALVHFNLGIAYTKKNLPDKAIAAYQNAVAHGGFKELPKAYLGLGMLLQKKGLPDEALAALEKSRALDDKDVQTHHYIGVCFHQKKQWDDAIAAYRKAIAIDAKVGPSYHGLGRALLGKGQSDESLAALKGAFDLQYEPAYSDYANSLLLRGLLDEAIVAYQKALAFKPKNAGDQSNYGAALEKKNRFAEAIVAFETALELDPGHTTAQKNLLVALRKQGQLLKKQARWEEAAAIYLKILKRDPHDGQAHLDLGGADVNLGRFADAIAAYQKGKEFKPSAVSFADSMIRSCEGLHDLEKKLPAIRSGEIKLKPDSDTRIPVTALCRIKKLYGLGARIYGAWLRDDPKLAEDVTDGRRYDAACFAALAAGGTGKDDPPLDDKERTRWRQKALEWLRADLAVWSKLAKAPNADRPTIRTSLTLWQTDADLQAVRESDALAKLPESERIAWRQLWREVADMLSQLKK